MKRMLENGIAITESEERKFFEIDAKIRALQGEKTALIRSVARAHGLIAKSLDGLKSKNGAPFVEERHSYINFRNSAARNGGPLKEDAYLCPGALPGGEDGCGWVKGSPKGERHDFLEPLSGGFGKKYYCRICGCEVGGLTNVLAPF